MSHFTTIQTEVRDLEALNDACVEMDLKLVANTTCRGYAGIRREADHVIQLKGPYDIAVDPAGGGRYGLTESAVSNLSRARRRNQSSTNCANVASVGGLVYGIIKLSL